MFDPVGEHFDLAGFFTYTTGTDGTVLATRTHTLRALTVHHLFEDTIVTQFDRRAIDANHTTSDLNLVTRQADQTLDVIATRHGMTEDHHIAPLGL